VGVREEVVSACRAGRRWLLAAADVRVLVRPRSRMMVVDLMVDARK
jgi:hypothetical protein